MADETEEYGRPDPDAAKKQQKAFKKHFDAAGMLRAHGQVLEIIRENEQAKSEAAWFRARAIHFVVLYAMLHKRVYKVDPIWTTEDRRRAALLAGQTLKKHFGGNPASFAAFMRWVWRREHGREKWARDEGKERHQTIGWRLQWSGVLLSEYFVSIAREA